MTKFLNFHYKLNQSLYLLLVCSILIKTFLAYSLQLSNDEVYYWTYALYPQWSYFDHPPMVSWVIQLFTYNLYFDQELNIRLGAIIISIINFFLVFEIGKLYGNHRKTAWYAVLMYTAHIYLSILAGAFILPDSPQILFCLLTIYFLLKAIPLQASNTKIGMYLMLAGLSMGLAGLSKYHAIFLAVGLVIFILFKQRSWLKLPSLYLSGILAFICISPVLIWNIENEFISFSFHTARITPDKGFQFAYFFRELFGQIIYSHPVIWFLIVIGVYHSFPKKFNQIKKETFLLLAISLPHLLTFLTFSLFRKTYPHWSGPAYIGLIFIAADYWSRHHPKRFIQYIKTSYILLCMFLMMSWGMIHFSPIPLGYTSPDYNLGRHDPTQDMFGWEQMQIGMDSIIQQDLQEGRMPEDTPFVSFRWFPGTHIDYYVAQPLKRKLYMMGPLKDIHHYHWINEYRGGFENIRHAYYLADSHWFRMPTHFDQYFSNIQTVPDTIKVYRAGKVVRYGLVYRMRGKR